jgi:uncharacterized membrane protein YphA (DoxX/SURF4 family)
VFLFSYFKNDKIMKLYLGRHIYGLGAITFGVITLTWHSFSNWHHIQTIGNIPHPEILAYIAGTIELIGGIAIQWQKTARIGSIILGAVFLIFALLWVPLIVKTPLVYDNWGNFFEQFSLVSGALIVNAISDPNNSELEAKIGRLGYIFFGICVISFMLEQLFYFSGTASFVPKWIPPSQIFWAIITTIAFALAAFAIFFGRFSLLASRLLTIMIIAFSLLIWFPVVFNDPHQLFNWAGNAQNLLIGGVAWIIADYLSQSKINPLR